MAALAEGLNILRTRMPASVRPRTRAEVAPLEEPEYYQFTIDLPKVAELWRRGSVISSWLLDLTAAALSENPTLEGFAGRVSDSGEGRWTVKAAVDVGGAGAGAVAASLFERFASRDEDHYANQLLSAMRLQFGGHLELPAGDVLEAGSRKADSDRRGSRMSGPGCHTPGMTHYAIDAPTALRIIDDDREIAPAHSLVGPSPLRSHALSSLYRDVRAGRMDERDARRRLDVLASLKIRLLGDRVSRGTAFRLAAQLEWDDTPLAEYLAVATLQADALITADAALRAAAPGIVLLADYEDLFR